MIGIAAAGQAGAEVAREREPEAVSESQSQGFVGGVMVKSMSSAHEFPGAFGIGAGVLPPVGCDRLAGRCARVLRVGVASGEHIELDDPRT